MADPVRSTFVDAVRAALRDIAVLTRGEPDAPFVLVPSGKIDEALRRLRDDPHTAMHQLMDISAVDYPDYKPRFEVVYQLLSLSRNQRLTVIVQTDEKVPSVVNVYPAAGWFEREAFDMFGLVFEGHPDPRRILTDYNFEGHPLRRDFPLMGIDEVFYDDLRCVVSKRPVHLEQHLRSFNTLSPWKGMTDVQKREGRGA